MNSSKSIYESTYRPEQIAAWSGRPFQTERWCQTMDKNMVWVVSDTERDIYGFGRQLIQIMLDECQKRNIQNISL